MVVSVDYPDESIKTGPATLHDTMVKLNKKELKMDKILSV